MATFTLFRDLPSEIQILILRHYLPEWEFGIIVGISPRIPANFRIGTGCPFNFNFLAAGRQSDLCALWSSRSLYEPAQKALKQSFTGEVRLDTPGNWHYPQRIPMFNAFVLPELPAQMIKRLILGVHSIKPGPPEVPKSYVTWKSLLEFIDFGKMPNLECLGINVFRLGRFDFGVDQIGDLLRGAHDGKISDWLLPILPPVRPDQQQQITTPSGRTLVIQILTGESIQFWVPTWKANAPEEKSSVTIKILLEGGNTQDIQVKSREIHIQPWGDSPGEHLILDGATWEAEAAKRWPKLKLDTPKD